MLKKKPQIINETDYQNFTTKDTLKDIRRERGVGDIWNNSIKCKKCNEIIRSKNLHDFRWCSCKSVAIDGGSWYAKVSGHFNDYEFLTEWYNDMEISPNG